MIRGPVIGLDRDPHLSTVASRISRATSGCKPNTHEVSRGAGPETMRYGLIPDPANLDVGFGVAGNPGAIDHRATGRRRRIGIWRGVGSERVVARNGELAGSIA
jgi:hypothetical protein